MATPASNRFARGNAVLGGLAVLLSTTFGVLWAYWGALENFHEGMYASSAWANLSLAFAQYLGPALGFVLLGTLSVRWPRLGAALHAALAVFAIWFFHSFAGRVLIGAPLAGVAALYAFARIPAPRLSRSLVVGLPLLTAIVCSVWPAWRHFTRVDDGERGARRLSAGADTLVWAPRGPGWPEQGGVNWREANERCARLSPDGTTLADTVVGAWRLPRVDEVVRFARRRGQPCDGKWNAETGTAAYRIAPDKETPLWDPHSPIIYWWTASPARHPRRVWMVVYDGKVWARDTVARMGSLGFRAVRDVRPGD